MSVPWWSYILGAAVGLAALLQGVFNAAAVRGVGIPLMLVLANGSAFALSLVAFLCLWWSGRTALLPVPAVSVTHAAIAGAMALVILAGVAVIANQHGYAWAFAVAISLQLSASVALDSLGILRPQPVPVSLNKLGAVVLIIVANWLLVRK